MKNIGHGGKISSPWNGFLINERIIPTPLYVHVAKLSLKFEFPISDVNSLFQDGSVEIQRAAVRTEGIKRAKSRGVNNKNWMAGWARTWQLHSKLTVAVVKVRERLYLALSCPSVGHSLCH